MNQKRCLPFLLCFMMVVFLSTTLGALDLQLEMDKAEMELYNNKISNCHSELFIKYFEVKSLFDNDASKTALIIKMNGLQDQLDETISKVAWLIVDKQLIEARYVDYDGGVPEELSKAFEAFEESYYSLLALYVMIGILESDYEEKGIEWEFKFETA